MSWGIARDGRTTRSDVAADRHIGRSRWLLAFGVALLAGSVSALAFWLRLRYVQNVDMSVDEFTSLWAARRTMETGAPQMLSGAYYLRGLLLSYHIAVLAEWQGLSRFVARLPGLVYGVAAVPLVLAMGWRGWNARVGLLAAIGLALLSEAIAASGKVRFYSLALFFASLSVWAQFELLDGADGARRARTWVTSLVSAFALAAALFSYEGALLLYPVLVLMALWWRGWRWFLQPPVLAGQIVCVAAILGRFGLELYGAHSYLMSMQEGKAIFAPLSETVSRVQALVNEFAPLRRSLWSLGGLIALGVAGVELARKRGRLAELTPYARATVVYALPLLAYVAALILVIGDDYGVERQLLIVRPLWLLVSAAGFLWVVDRITTSEVARWAAAVALILALGALQWPYALRVAEHTELGYEVALRWLAGEVQPGDVTLSPQPSACAAMLDQPCTYYMRSKDYEAYVLPGADGPIDMWSGAPLLSTMNELAEVIQNAPRTWIIIDEQRLGRRHPTNFIELVAREFQPVFEHAGVWVLRADEWRPLRTYSVRRRLTPFIPMGPLTLTGIARDDPQPGHGLPVRLTWNVAPDTRQQVNTSLQLVAADGTRITQDDGPPANGLVSTMAAPNVALPDAKTLMLPDAMKAGRYRLDVSTYEALTDRFLAGPTPVDWFWLGPKPTPLPARDVAWEAGIRLDGADVPEGPWTAGAPLKIDLAWSAQSPTETDYVFFVQLLDAEGRLVAQADREPGGGFYPTSAWRIGESVQDSYTLDLPASLAPGDYTLITGVYRRDNLERLHLAGGGDAYHLDDVTVE